MKQQRWIACLRVFEQVGLLIFLCGPLYVLWWWFELGAEPGWTVATVLGISFFGLGVYLFTGHQINHKIDLLTSQSDFAVDGQFLALFERSPVPYIVIEHTGQIAKLNQVAVKLLAAPAAELIGTNLLQRFVESEDSDVSIIVQKVKSGATLTDEKVALQLDNGELVWVLLSSYASQPSDQNFISLVDITQDKRVDAAKSEFLALATHQLGTPIAAIRWNTELLKKRLPSELTETIGGYITKIHNNTERMTSLIDDFLNVSKLELGTFATEQTPIAMNEFLDSIVDEYQAKFVQKHLQLSRDYQPAEFTFNSDPRLLHIIVSNLVSNATKYVKESGTIWLTTSLQDNLYHIMVADDGIGIPRSELDRLFTKFYRASNATKQQAEGTGLGLYVVRQAVTLLGGTVKVETDTDKGAKFTVTLPMR
jgi:PAS domain S-box-containing protein